MDVCCCAEGINHLISTDVYGLKYLLKHPEGQSLLVCLVEVRLSHNIACKHDQVNSKSGASSRFSLDIPSAAINVKEVPNHLLLYDIIHKWLEEQIDFQL